MMPLGDPNWSLAQYLNFALWIAGASYLVGEKEDPPAPDPSPQVAPHSNPYHSSPPPSVIPSCPPPSEATSAQPPFVGKVSPPSAAHQSPPAENMASPPAVSMVNPADGGSRAFGCIGDI